MYISNLELTNHDLNVELDIELEGALMDMITGSPTTNMGSASSGSNEVGLINDWIDTIIGEFHGKGELPSFLP